MLAAIFNRSTTRTAKLSLLIALSAFTSCATKEKPPLVSSGNDRESSLPWNQQQKWENQGQLGGMAERFNTR
jgi:hypothetical protein